MCFSCSFCLFCTCKFLSFFSSSWYRGLDAVCDCGTPWTVLLTSFQLLKFSTFRCFRVGLLVEYSSCFVSVMNLNLYVHCFDALLSRSASRGPEQRVCL